MTGTYRQAPRARVDCEAVVVTAEGWMIRGAVRDVSPVGLSILSQAGLLPGTPCSVRVQQRPGGTDPGPWPARFEGTVLRGDDDHFVVALTSADARARAWLARLGCEPPGGPAQARVDSLATTGATRRS